LKELQNAIENQSDAGSTRDSPRSSSGATFTPLATMRRSKSLGSLEDPLSTGEKDGDEEKLPSLASLGLSFNPSDQHGYEELKRGRGENGGRLATSSSHSNLSALVDSCSRSRSNSLSDGGENQAASALMQLSSTDNQPSAAKKEGTVGRSRVEETVGTPIVLPPLRDLIAATQANSLNDDVANKLKALSFSPSSQVKPQPSDLRPIAKDPPPSTGASQSAAATQPPAQSQATGASQATPASQPSAQPVSDSQDGDSADAKHNKYCHFCQHVKVKRITSMLACENMECARRFCEHCLMTHLHDVVPPDGRGLKELCDGKWLCPICRKVCCCAIQVCNRAHRHCKAYRYRQRRAEQAAKRSLDHNLVQMGMVMNNDIRAMQPGAWQYGHMAGLPQHAHPLAASAVVGHGAQVDGYQRVMGGMSNAGIAKVNPMDLSQASAYNMHTASPYVHPHPAVLARNN